LRLEAIIGGIKNQTSNERGRLWLCALGAVENYGTIITKKQILEKKLFLTNKRPFFCGFISFVPQFYAARKEMLKGDHQFFRGRFLVPVFKVVLVAYSKHYPRLIDAPSSITTSSIFVASKPDL
jgi:hypothetical protein